VVVAGAGGHWFLSPSAPTDCVGTLSQVAAAALKVSWREDC